MRLLTPLLVICTLSAAPGCAGPGGPVPPAGDDPSAHWRDWSGPVFLGSVDTRFEISDERGQVTMGSGWLAFGGRRIRQSGREHIFHHRRVTFPKRTSLKVYVTPKENEVWHNQWNRLGVDIEWVGDGEHFPVEAMQYHYERIDDETEVKVVKLQWYIGPTVVRADSETVTVETDGADARTFTPPLSLHLDASGHVLNAGS